MVGLVAIELVVLAAWGTVMWVGMGVGAGVGENVVQKEVLGNTGDTVEDTVGIVEDEDIVEDTAVDTADTEDTEAEGSQGRDAHTSNFFLELP